MAIDLEQYNTVPERIAEFAEKHPEGSFQQVSIQFVNIANVDWIVYTAAAYRGPDDVRPGHGTAWERVPGLTPYTKNSEMQNAETSAWGRAIVAALAADTRKGSVASLSEVQARQAERDPEALTNAVAEAYKATTKAQLRPLYNACISLGVSKPEAEKIRKYAESLPEREPEVDPAAPLPGEPV